MAVDHRYEAWRNFVLIVAGVLVADSFATFGQIRHALLSLCAFDRAFTTVLWPEIITSLIVFYVVKNAHGILITLFDHRYLESVRDSRTRVLVWCLLTSCVIVSFTLVLRLAQLVEYGWTLNGRASRVMLFTFFPSVVLLLFDLFHLAVHENGGPVKGLNGGVTFLKAVSKELIMKNPRDRRDQHSYKKVWIAEDVLSLAAVGFWWVAMNYICNIPKTKIFITLVTLAAVLTLNSVVDYFLNINYFFFYKGDKHTE